MRTTSYGNDNHSHLENPERSKGGHPFHEFARIFFNIPRTPTQNSGTMNKILTQTMKNRV